MTPQYRIEQYLSSIISGFGGTKVAWPENPAWRIEEFLDAIITYIWEDEDNPRHPCPEPAWHREECLRAIYDALTGAADPCPFPTTTDRIDEFLYAIYEKIANNNDVAVPEPSWDIEEWLKAILDVV